MRRYWFALLSLATVAACSKQTPPAAPPPPEVGVIVVNPASVPLQKDLVGRLAPFRSADVRARVPGVLQKRVYAEGSDVREGQLLFVIDPAPLQAALSQSQASLAQAQANYTNAKVAADRARQLAPTNFISKSDLDNALAAERSAAASVQAGKAAVDSARINLGYASVRSPIAGRAGKQQVTEGALVGQGDATLLTTVDQVDPLYVNFSLSVTELEQVRRIQRGQAQGQTQVQVLLPDGTPYERMGVLDFSGDVVDPSTGAIALRARIPNPDKTLLPGTYVTLKATLGTQPNVFLVPQGAVQRDASSAYVLVVGPDGKVVRKDIVTERSQGTNWVVGKGLAAGDRIVVSGVQRAQPGQPVKAVPYQANAGKAAPPGAKKEGEGAAAAGN
ncbi:efflux RND transporter periplasmic adaptor subunit [Luteimonas sp. SX5]|uniref:Efflux RND transporter periplasmic adaptor subunit n=1 Tax=Luteimonas galliterrae TaxID=2940486 RepID=A0ABT0ML49_9GAMM|nr:efflux RND transporter periplasmic adaptor subunit [Luteimonas galliterrae]MCL1635609.1 efflux RND transporter periplasmic adaptor subunit [Luteimonas galliterrae]